MDDVAEKVSRSLRLDRQAVRAPPDARQKETRGLDAALGPTFLLDLYGAHLRRQLARNLHVTQKDEAPPGELRPVAQVEIFSQRCRPPASRILHTRPPPHPGRAVEVEEEPAAEAGLVFDLKVTVQQKGLRAREPVVALVQVAPRRLHHADVRVGEGRQEPSQQIGLRGEVRVQNEEEISPGTPEPMGQGPGLVATSRPSAEMLDASSPSTPGGHSSRGDGGRLVRRVVEQLDLEAIARIVEGARRVDQPADDVRLVVDGQLHGDAGQLADPVLRQPYRRPPQPAPEHHQPVGPEGQEKHQHQRVRKRGGERDGPAGVSGVTQRFLHRGRLGWFLSIIRECTLSAGRTSGSRLLAFRTCISCAPGWRT